MTIGDHLFVKQRAEESADGWWLVQNCQNGNKGWVPSTHMSKLDETEAKEAKDALETIRSQERKRKKKNSKESSTNINKNAEVVDGIIAGVKNTSDDDKQITEPLSPRSKKASLAKRAMRRLSRTFTAKMFGKNNFDDNVSNDNNLSSDVDLMEKEKERKSRNIRRRASSPLTNDGASLR